MTNWNVNFDENWHVILAGKFKCCWRKLTFSNIPPYLVFLNWKCNSAPFLFDHDGESSIYLLLVCAQWIPLTSQFGFKSKKGSFGNIFLQWIYKVILVLFIQQMFALWNVKLELTSPPFNVRAQHLFVEKAIHVAIGTGCSDWKLSKVNGYSAEKVHIWPIVGKAKMRLRAGSFFEKL